MKTPESFHRTPNLTQALLDSEFINILYITSDLLDSDVLAHSLRSVASGMHLEASFPDFKRVEDLFRVKKYDLLLLDNRIAATESELLISHLDSKNFAPSVIVIIGADDKHPAPTLLALADDSIVRGPNYLNRLTDLLKRAYVRSRLSIKRRNPIPQPATAEDTVDKNTSIGASQESKDTPEKVQQQGSDIRNFPRKQVNLPCSLKWDGNSYTARIYDLSEEGAFIINSSLPNKGASIHLAFYFEGNEITQESIVVHEGWYLGGDNNFFGFGIQFCNITGDARIVYKKIIAGSLNQAQNKTVLTT
jgi:response regulator of citrate/malate metabolism